MAKIPHIREVLGDEQRVLREEREMILLRASDFNTGSASQESIPSKPYRNLILKGVEE